MQAARLVARSAAKTAAPPQAVSQYSGTHLARVSGCARTQLPAVRALGTDTRPAEFTERLEQYREQMKGVRRDLGAERRRAGDTGPKGKKRKKDGRSEAEIQADATARREERIQRAQLKHERSLKNFERHKVHIAEAKARRVARKKPLYVRWQENQAEVEGRRAGLVAALDAASASWVTAETLDAHIEQAVDDLLIESTQRTVLA